MEETKDEILLRNFFKIINRNKIFSTKISLIFLSIILLISFIQRRINPSFQGSTLLLIKDPFEASITDSLNSPLERSSFSDEFIDLTFNRIETDFPTLIVLLKSRKILDPIIKKHKLSHRYLTRALKITSGGQGNNFKEEARGVLDIKLNMSDAQKTKDILNDISKEYLSLSLESRQKYLSDGLSFLDNQLPIISQKTKSIQKRISNFRVTNFLVEPKNKAATIKQREKNLDENIAILESERKRLEKIRDEIKNGTITAISFQEAINKTSSTYPYF